MFRTLREDIRCVFDRDPAARNAFEVLTTYPGVHAVIVHRFAHRLWKMKLKWLARWVSMVSRWLTGIEIHPGAVIGRRFFIDHGMGVVIGETAIIGDDCTLYHGVTLGGTSWEKGKRHPTLGDGVIVGAGAKVLGPIKIGNNSRIGSNSVVVKAVPADTTVVGVPAHALGEKDGSRKVGKRLDFDAYGIPVDADDPIESAIEHILSHIRSTDERLLAMIQSMQEKGLGKDLDTSEFPHLQSLGDQAESTVDKEKPSSDRASQTG
ncbi:MAG: serine O-acetyltransferase [Gammaproteobacteria bacterium]|nr:MAG: serine O-acetyltransferase [Gammaproteobacteria bacterium]